MIAQGEQHEGIDRLNALLEDPNTFKGLEEFVAKLPEINDAMELIRSFLASSSRMADNANGIMKTARDAMGDFDAYETQERLRTAATAGTRVASELGPTLSDPETLANVRRLAEMLPKLVDTMGLLEQFLAGSSRFADNLNSIVSTARRT